MDVNADAIVRIEYHHLLFDSHYVCFVPACFTIERFPDHTYHYRDSSMEFPNEFDSVTSDQIGTVFDATLRLLAAKNDASRAKHGDLRIGARSDAYVTFETFETFSVGGARVYNFTDFTDSDLPVWSAAIARETDLPYFAAQASRDLRIDELRNAVKAGETTFSRFFYDHVIFYGRSWDDGCESGYRILPDGGIDVFIRNEEGIVETTVTIAPDGRIAAVFRDWEYVLILQKNGVRVVRDVVRNYACR